jgi:hypothetical protein
MKNKKEEIFFANLFSFGAISSQFIPKSQKAFSFIKYKGSR